MISYALTPPPAMFRLGEGWVRIFSDTEDIGLNVTGERQTSIVVKRRWNQIPSFKGTLHSLIE